MRGRQPSIADSLVDGRTLLDGRYRLDALIRRSATTTVHAATHRNGSSAWLKLPASAAHADLIALEARIANTLSSPLIVRDDGSTPDGTPYLVLDVPDAESVMALRARWRDGARLPLAHVMTMGEALTRLVASLHAMSLVTAGLDEEDVLIFANGDVALLDLHALAPATPHGMAADVRRLRSVLSGLVADVSDGRPATPSRTILDGVLTSAHEDVAALHAAWRSASREPIAPPTRTRSGSFAALASSRAVPNTPVAMSPEVHRDPDGSMIGYLRSGNVPSISSISLLQADLREQDVVTDPFSQVAEMPRLVQATSRPPGAAPKHRLLVGMLLATALAGAAFLVSASRAGAVRVPATAIANLAPATATPPTADAIDPGQAPPAVPFEQESTPAESDPDGLELSTLLRSERAPPDRDVIIDGKAVGRTPLHVSVPCGSHTLQMLAGAPKVEVELPCGGERVVRYDARGRWSLK